MPIIKARCYDCGRPCKDIRSHICGDVHLPSLPTGVTPMMTVHNQYLVSAKGDGDTIIMNLPQLARGMSKENVTNLVCWLILVANIGADELIDALRTIDP